MGTREDVLGMRLSASERQALRTLAKREDRTESGWLRARLIVAAREAGLLDANVDQADVDQGHQVAQAA